MLITLQWLALAEIHCFQRRSLLTDSNGIKTYFKRIHAVNVI